MGTLPRTRRRWLIAALAMIALVFVLRLYLSWVGPIPGDRAALRRALEYHPPGELLSQITSLWATVGSALTATLTLLVAGCTVWRSDGSRGLTGLALAAVVVIINAVLKLLLSPTPLWHQYFHLVVGNYPSGHVAYASAVLGYLGILGLRHRRPEVLGICVLLIIGMGPARVIDGSHLVSDAIAGYLLGFGWLILVMLLLDGWGRPGAPSPRHSGSVRAASASPPRAARTSSE